MTLEDYALYDEIQRRIDVAKNFPDSARAELDIKIYTLAQKALEKIPEGYGDKS